MTCDDNVNSLIGNKLIGIFVRPIEDVEDRYGIHEICFLEIQTNKNNISIATHNEHNGYYGGFNLNIQEL